MVQVFLIPDMATMFVLVVKGLGGGIAPAAFSELGYFTHY